MIIYTNNILVEKKYKEKVKVIFVEGNYGQVLIKVRDQVHLGCHILNHPLYGSVKPNETPFRSVAVEEGKELDLESVDIIEYALLTYKKYMENAEKIKQDKYPDEITDDFRMIDLDLFSNAMDGIIKA
ncbi:MAG: GrdX family protein [Peptostreptococcaceae bacterium]|nr:GrdX family protein [Peptostreptococcaceae bacterium]